MRWIKARGVFATVVSGVAALLPLIADPFDGGPLVRYVPATLSQAYAYSLVVSADSAPGPARKWIAEGQAALLDAAPLELPAELTLNAGARATDATAYRLSGRLGRRLSVHVAVPSENASDLFVELFESGPSTFEPIISVPAQASGEETAFQYVWHGLRDAELVLRVQTALGYEGPIEVRVEESPLLAFPVAGHGARSIQSGFGAERDGGRRAHRGVDIFADRGTEVLASMDGWVVRVDTTPRGGNVVWFQPMHGNLRLYYAHLDTQLVSQGDFVLQGDVLGTVGNTGNAITTPPHLHYGVYLRRRGRRGGARDPVDFLL